MVVQMAYSGPAAGPLEGKWGGDRLQLVFDAGAGRVEMDCASGTFVGPIKWTGTARFDAGGTFQQYQSGPQRADEAVAPGKASYSGEIKDDVMKLSILPAGASAPQVFTLRRGVAVKLVRCL